MTVRHATADDFEALRALWDRWQSESVAPPWADVSWEANQAQFERALDANALFLAEEDGEPLGFVTAWLEDHFAKIGDLYVTGAGRREGTGSALVDTVVENLRARGATHLFVNVNLHALAFYEKLGFREESRNLVLPLRGSLGGRRPFVRLDSRAVGRSRLGRARRPAVRAAAARRVARKQRHATAQRLDHGLRRCLRSRPVGAAPPGDRAVGTHGRRRDRDRRRARAGRPLRPLRGGTHRRRVPLRAGALRSAAAG